MWVGGWVGGWVGVGGGAGAGGDMAVASPSADEPLEPGRGVGMGLAGSFKPVSK